MQSLLFSGALVCLTATLGAVLVAHGEPAAPLSAEVETVELRASQPVIEQSGRSPSADEEDAAGPVLAFATVEAGDGFRLTRGITRGSEDAALAGSEQHPLNAAHSDPSIAEEPRAAIVPIPTPRPARMVSRVEKAQPVEVERRVSDPAAKQKQRWTRRTRSVERTLRTAESLPRQERRERLRRYWVTGGFR
ncbi:hypothetical protein [Jiella marina]|uniref:hypothetical protein n=1 Tax=Jiella sp. LLJ827 TaxID=2917712 RepID=UPI002100BBF1|nr:hypothetical protein [Jiella sp. LLJ827]MCQ0990457.1 hypothetical protein [Jiella sp. LLJ827]